MTEISAELSHAGRVVSQALGVRIFGPTPAGPFFLAKCLPSWPPSPDIRTARAKFTDFDIFLFRIST